MRIILGFFLAGSHTVPYVVSSINLIFQEIFQDWGEQKSETSLEELRADSLKVQRVLAEHKVTQHRYCVGEKDIKSSSQHVTNN